jgi:hypothetical protein
MIGGDAVAKEKITRSYALQLGGELGVDWRLVSLDQFIMGLEVEQEHMRTVDGDMHQVARIALDHIAEYPDYYTRLAKMERAAKSYWKYRYR